MIVLLTFSRGGKVCLWMKWAKMEALTYDALLVDKHAIDYTVPSILFEFWKAVVDIIQMYIVYAVIHFKTHMSAILTLLVSIVL